LPGARRPVVTPVTLGDPPLQEDSHGPGTSRLFFSLPAGSYATVLLEALGVALGS
jgi:tRNA(Glu) U13 pseudouridine synthase TruD